MWIIWAFLGSFFETSRDILSKKASRTIHPYTSAFSLNIWSGILLLPFVLLNGLPHLTIQYWLAVMATAIVGPTAAIAYMKAVRTSAISEIIPILALDPVFASILSLFLGGKTPSTAGWISILIITLGIYLAAFQNKQKYSGIASKLLYPFRQAGALFMLAATFLWSCGVHITRLGIESTNPLFFVWTVGIVNGIIILLVGIYTKNIRWQEYKKSFWNQLFLGLANIGGSMSIAQALTYGFTPYIAAVKRSNIIWSSIIGVTLWKEKGGLYKYIGISLAFAGLVLLILYK